MPKTKRTRKYGGRKRRVFKRKQAVSTLNTLSPLPSRYITKHKYSSAFTMDTVINEYNWNINSLYDPDRTGFGHQPYGYDQLSGLYGKYRVIGCSYVISGIQADNPGTNIRLACNPHNEAIVFSSMDHMLESPRTKYIVQGAQGSPLKTLKGYVSIPSIVGKTKAQYMADDRYAATVGLNPAELAILTVRGGTMYNTNALVSATITLEFTVEWFDITQQNQS